MHAIASTFENCPIRRYAEIRPDIRSGDLLLCSGESVMSRMIRRATSSPWSHIGLIARIEAVDRVLVLESVESIGVRAAPLSRYLGDDPATGRGYDGRVVIARYAAVEHLGPDQLRAMFAAATDLLGTRYDNAEILRIAGRILRSELPFSRHRHDDRQCTDAESNTGVDLARDGLYICSEYVWECFRAAGIVIPPNPLRFIAPCDFVADRAVRVIAQIHPASTPQSGKKHAAQP